MSDFSPIETLRSCNKALIRFLAAQEAWEADLLVSDTTNIFDHMTDKQHDAFMEVQRLRNIAKETNAITIGQDQPTNYTDMSSGDLLQLLAERSVEAQRLRDIAKEVTR